MNRTDFEDFVAFSVESEKQIRLKKGKEYSGDSDVLSNFREVGQEIGITKEQVCLVYMLKHWRAIVSSIRNCQPSVESRTRFQDLRNYLYLLEALTLEVEIFELDQLSQGIPTDETYRDVIEKTYKDAIEKNPHGLDPFKYKIGEGDPRDLKLTPSFDEPKEELLQGIWPEPTSTAETGKIDPIEKAKQQMQVHVDSAFVSTSPGKPFSFISKLSE